MSQWLVRRGNRPALGPFSLAFLERSVKSGKLLLDAEVCRVGEASWRPLAEVVGSVQPDDDDDAPTGIVAAPWFKPDAGAAGGPTDELPADIDDDEATRVFTQPELPDADDDEATRVVARLQGSPFAAAAAVKPRPIARARPANDEETARVLKADAMAPEETARVLKTPPQPEETARLRRSDAADAEDAARLRKAAPPLPEETARLRKAAPPLPEETARLRKTAPLAPEETARVLRTPAPEETARVLRTPAPDETARVLRTPQDLAHAGRADGTEKNVDVPKSPSSQAAAPNGNGARSRNEINRVTKTPPPIPGTPASSAGVVRQLNSAPSLRSASPATPRSHVQPPPAPREMVRSSPVADSGRAAPVPDSNSRPALAPQPAAPPKERAAEKRATTLPSAIPPPLPSSSSKLRAAPVIGDTGRSPVAEPLYDADEDEENGPNKPPTSVPISVRHPPAPPPSAAPELPEHPRSVIVAVPHERTAQRRAMHRFAPPPDPWLRALLALIVVLAIALAAALILLSRR